MLNLPVGRHSAGLARWAAVEAARGSFEDVGAAIERTTGVRLGKRQVEQLARAAAVDVDGFYAACRPSGCPADRVLVLPADGKGIVMHPDGLREATARTAAKTRENVIPAPGRRRREASQRRRGPVATGKWLTASVTDDIPAVIRCLFGGRTP